MQNWIEIDEEYEADIALRRKLVAEQRDIVIQSTPEVLLLPCHKSSSSAKHFNAVHFDAANISQALQCYAFRCSELRDVICSTAIMYESSFRPACRA